MRGTTTTVSWLTSFSKGTVVAVQCEINHGTTEDAAGAATQVLYALDSIATSNTSTGPVPIEALHSDGRPVCREWRICGESIAKNTEARWCMAVAMSVVG